MVHSDSGSCQGIDSAIPQVVRSAAPQGPNVEMLPLPKKTKPTLPVSLAGGIREHLRFLISQLTRPPTVKPGTLVPLEFGKLSRRRLRPFVTVIDRKSV